MKTVKNCNKTVQEYNTSVLCKFWPDNEASAAKNCLSIHMHDVTTVRLKIVFQQTFSIKLYKRTELVFLLVKQFLLPGSNHLNSEY